MRLQRLQTGPCLQQGESACSTICRRDIRLAETSREIFGLIRAAISMLPQFYLEMPSSFAVFVGGVSGGRSPPRYERSTAACRCHQCTRRAHSLLKDEITISAWLFSIPLYGYRISFTVLKVFQNCRFLLYFVLKGLILFQSLKTHAVMLCTSFISIPWNRNHLNFHTNLSRILK